MDFNHVYHQPGPIRKWFKEETGFQIAVDTLLYNTGYKFDAEDFFMTRSNFSAGAWVDHNGREFVIYTRGGEWDQVEAANLLSALQNATNLAFHLNSLVQGCGERFEREGGQI